MKKIISLILVLVMVLSMAVAASATTFDFAGSAGTHIFTNKGAGNETVIPPYTAQGEVTVSITPPTVETVYKVDVVWGDLDFEYSFGDEAVWDPETHTFIGGTNPGWQGATTGTVAVTNHSNKALVVAHTLTSDEQNNVKVTASWDDANLDSADGAAYYGKANADVATLTVAIDDPSKVPSANADFKIGDLTITISVA